MRLFEIVNYVPVYTSISFTCTDIEDRPKLKTLYGITKTYSEIRVTSVGWPSKSPLDRTLLGRFCRLCLGLNRSAPCGLERKNVNGLHLHTCSTVA